LAGESEPISSPYQKKIRLAADGWLSMTPSPAVFFVGASLDLLGIKSSM
jgi:hypothetical protein